MHPMARTARFTVLTLTALALVTGPATAGRAGVRVAFLPKHALEGTRARFGVAVNPAGSICTLRVRYHDGSVQPGLRRVVATHGRASWSWSVPTSVQAGAAVATVRCGRAGSLSRRIVIVGRVVEPKMVVEKTGFSMRASASGATRLSYGIILHNPSPTQDATNVTVQTNFVLADDHLLGTDNRPVAVIPAGGDYALGSMVSFPGAAPIVRLEVVVQVRSFVEHSVHLPTLDNIHIVPKLSEPSWVGTIEGELQNTDPTMTLRTATLSAVVFDADGNIVGGGSGFASQQLPPGAREFLRLGNGFDVIPVNRAAATTISISPSWMPTGP
jgi:hypothetical protein